MHWIDRILVDFNLTQRQLSKGSGVSESSLSTNRGARTPIRKSGANMVYKLSKFLELTMDEMYERYGN